MRIIHTRKTKSNTAITAMAYMAGNNVKVPFKLPFSFGFSDKYSNEGKETQHTIRVKVTPKPNGFKSNENFVIYLHGDWDVDMSRIKQHIPQKFVNDAIKFFKLCRVIFSGVWETVIPPEQTVKYFRGLITFSEFVDFMNLSDENKQRLWDCETQLIDKQLDNMADGQKAAEVNPSELIQLVEKTVKKYNMFKIY